MKVDIDCIIYDGKAEISISLFERVSRPEFEEYAGMLRREGFEYDSYTKSNVFTTESLSMLAAMFKFLDKEFEVSAKLRGKEDYTWDERDKFVQDFKASLYEKEKSEEEKESDKKKHPKEEKESEKTTKEKQIEESKEKTEELEEKAEPKEKNKQ
jgi:hypothetical protein